MLYEVMFWILDIVGMCLIVFGCLLLFIRSHMREPTMEIIMGPVKIVIGKGGVSTGIVCIAFGAFLLFLAWSMVVGGAPTASLSLSTTVLAQERFGQSTKTEPSPETAKGAWAYLGSEDRPDEWVFNTLIHAPDKVEILQATANVNLYADHYDAWTGSLVGTLLRSEAPEVVDRIDGGECVYVRSRQVVGLGKIWLNVVPLQCAPAQEVLERAESLAAGLLPQ